MAESTTSYQAEPIIHVGIVASYEIQFELKGSFLCNSEVIRAGLYSISRETLEDENLEYIPQTDSSTFILKKVAIGIGFHWEQMEDQEFKGSLILQVEGNKVRAVNAVPLEDYLTSVISSEMSAMNDQNLLNAHAIVSRSWLLAQILKKHHPEENPYKTRPVRQVSIEAENDEMDPRKQSGEIDEIVKWYDREDHDTFDVCADDHCQRYQGITKVLSVNAENAVKSTRGQVLTYMGEICDARFSKCCGGLSEDFSNVWQNIRVPYLVAVGDFIPPGNLVPPAGVEFIQSSPEAFCNTSDPEILSQVLVDFDRSTTNFFRWTVEYSQSQLSDLLKRKSGFDFGHIIDLVPIERGRSGRITRLLIAGEKRKLIVGKELEIRKYLSESHLFSSAFVVEQVMETGNPFPLKFILHGAGWGHGVGMCQIGAAVMSRRGFQSEEILKHYFSGACIERLYP